MNALPTSHRPNITSLEIHITYKCNLACYNCSNLVDSAPSREEMPIVQLQQLLDDSAALKWPWQFLRLHGGEPVLHRQFEEICTALENYKRDHNPTVNLEVMSNGFSAVVLERHSVAVRHGINIGNSFKKGVRDIGHVTFNRSPHDLGEDYNLGCFQTSCCGIAYCVQGFYECSPAASAYRVLNYPPIVTRLSELTEEKLATGFAEHCKHCGFARLEPYERTAVAEPTQTWRDGLLAYKSRKI